MRLLKEYIGVFYVALVFPIVFFIGNYFILQSTTEIYEFIPQESDIVIEVNSKNFIKEIVYQRIFNEAYFKKKFPPTKDKHLLDEAPIQTGIDVFSQLIFFRESWSNEDIWFFLVKIQNKKQFEEFLIEKNLDLPKSFSSNEKFCILQLTASTNQVEVEEHLKNIAEKNTKSILSKIDIEAKFDPKNEINAYISPSNSKHIIDGFLYMNFDVDKIKISGEFSPINKEEKIEFIKYQPENEKALTLRSSLNLLNSIYLFNETKLDNLPEYSQLAFDYDGVKMLLSDNTIPIHAYPYLNVKFEIKEKLIWENYINELKEKGDIIIDKNKIITNKEGKSTVFYEINDTIFKLYQDKNNFTSNFESKDYFYLNIKPELFLDKTIFVNDSLNPPGFIASIKTDIIQNLFKRMDYWKEIKNISFLVSDKESNYFVCNGEILFNSKEGHSMIESLVISEYFIGTIGSFFENN